MAHKNNYFDYEDRNVEREYYDIANKLEHGIRPFRYIFYGYNKIVWKTKEDNLYKNYFQCYYFKREISDDDIRIMEENNIKIAVFDDSFNYPIDKLPNNVKYIIFFENGIFNQPIYKFPSSLEYLSLSGEFNQRLDNLPNLYLLILGNKFNQSLYNFPSSLQVLEIGEYIAQDYHNCNLSVSINNLPDSIVSLSIYTNKLDTPITKLPNNLLTAILPIGNKSQIMRILPSHPHKNVISIEYYNGYT